MVMTAALARVATRLLRGGLPPSASDSVLFSRGRLFCSRPAADEPSSPEGVEEQWEAAEAEILRDVEPVVELVKDILHSGRGSIEPGHRDEKLIDCFRIPSGQLRYGDCGILSPDDEKVVVEKLLVHHPCAEDKIGCGIDAIMVDKHPYFRRSRCLFVVRTNGDREDFSYRKCLRAYIEGAYPSHADRFMHKHIVQRQSQHVRLPK